MKILFSSTYFYPYISGLTVYPWQILKNLSKTHQVTVLTFNHEKNKLKKLKIKNLKFKIIYLPYLFRFSKGFISPQSFFYFFKEVKNANLLFFNQPNVEGLPLMILAKIFKKKTLSLLHCFLETNKKNLLDHLIIKLANKVVKLQLLLSDKIVAYTKKYLENSSIYEKIKNKVFFTLPPIKKLKVDKNFYQKLKKKKQGVWIGFSGRIASEKGIEYLIKSIRSLTFNVLRLTLVFAGPYGKDVSGENNYYQKIKRILDEEKINYVFLGNLSEKQLGAFYKVIDVLVLPSVNSTEAFGMVQAEAMLLGTPVVATNLPGVKIPISLTKMGIIVEPKNEKQLAKAISEILKNRKKYTNKNLIKAAEKIFNIKNVYQFYQNIIK
jgi:glycosyltransferase involved in cell wall biosynthesis